MPSNYSPNAANNPSAITLPSDGDEKPAATVNVAIEALADKIAYTQALLTSTASYVRAVLTPYRYSAEWAYANLGSDIRLKQITTANAGDVVYRLDLPNGATVNEIRVYLKGATGHAGVMPTTPPQVGVVLQLADASSSTNGVAFPYDNPAGGTPEYEDAHYVSISSAQLPPGMNPISRAYTFYDVFVCGETGGTAVIGLRILGVVAYFTAPWDKAAS